MEQFTSSKEHFEIGKTNYNRNFNMGNDIIIPIAQIINEKDKNLISDGMLSHILKYANSKEGFHLLDNPLRMAFFQGIAMKTKHGKVFQVASGVSKTAICLINENGIKSVIKYNRYSIKASDLRTFNNDSNADKFYQQITSQKNTYKRLENTEEIVHHLLPPFKYYKRYNAVIEPYAEHIGNANKYVTIGELDHFFQVMRKYHISDIHDANYGIYKGELVAIDYGL